MLLSSIMWLVLLSQERNFAIDRNWKLWTTETTRWGDTNDSPDASQNSRLIVGRQKVPHCDFTWLMSPLESVATKIQLRGCKWGFRSKAKRPPGRSISYYLLTSWGIVCVWWLAMWLGEAAANQNDLGTGGNNQQLIDDHSCINSWPWSMDNSRSCRWRWWRRSERSWSLYSGIW